MLAEGPLDQVLGFLMASMPDDVRICLNLFSGKYFEYSRQADKQIIRGYFKDFFRFLKRVFR